MIVADSSAWIEFLRRTGSPIHLELRRLIDTGKRLATTEVVLMEVLAGATSAREAEDLRVQLLGFKVLRLRPVTDFAEAAALHRACRAGGETVRSIADCLIAVPAIRAGAPILHANRDFEAIARHSALRIHQPAGG